MTGSFGPYYVPALRMKTGELIGVRDLAVDVASCVLPRMIVPPREERDEDMQAKLFEGDSVPGVGSILSNYWRNRSVFVEATHLIGDFGREKIGNWLPKMFDTARAASVWAIPAVGVAELLRAPSAYKAAISLSDAIQLGIIVSSSDLVDRKVIEEILRCLEGLGISPPHCSIIADFHDADFSNVEFVAPVIVGAVELLQEAGLWRQIVFQGTNYPEKNPAEPGGYCLIPRNEWKAWRRAVSFDPSTAEHLLFGDYAADCAKLVFGGSGGAAIRHYRYTTGGDWLVERGAKSGADKAIMRAVCERIIASEHFAGRSFSSADDFIFRTAKGLAGPGSSTTWRGINTTHHITRVVADIGEVRGFRIAKKATEPLPVQVPLF